MGARSILSRLNRDQRGISAVIVAVSLVGLFGAAMLSLDAGNMWQTRRNIITATDSTALDQARYLALAGSLTSNCQLTWTDYMLRNGGAGTTPITCVVNGTPGGSGWVGVDGRKTAETRVGGLLGIGDTHPYSFSAAEWGFVTEPQGLRPMGVCAANDHVGEWLAFRNGGSETTYNGLRGNPVAQHPIYTGAGVVHRIMYTKDNVADCGGAPGNWGLMDFECNNDADTPSSVCGNSTSTLNDLIRYGYQRPVGINDCDADADNTGGESGDYCNGDTGAPSNSIAPALQSLIDNQTRFTIPIFDEISGTGNTAYFDMHLFVGVRLHGFRVTGPETGRYLDMEFLSLATSGACCASSPPGGIDTGLRGTRLCAVDHDSQTEAARCG